MGRRGPKPWPGRFRRAGLLLILGVRTMAAQEARITGHVRDPLGRPLAGAQVVFREFPGGATTSAAGVYRIVVSATDVRGQPATLTARMFGHAPSTVTLLLTPGDQTRDFTLREDPLHLEDVVVTGTSSAFSTRKLPFSVGRLDESQLQDVPALTPLGALAGRVSGLALLQSTGTPGTAPNIRLRGGTSIVGRQDPLIIIDGTISRGTLADIASEDIIRIEVLKGAAAASYYGSDAANGVIQIFTRRGANLADGALRITTRHEAGVSAITRHLKLNESHFYQVEPDPTRSGRVRFLLDSTGNRIPEPDLISDNPYPNFRDHQTEVFRPSAFYSGFLSLQQRRGPLNYSASFQQTHDGGALLLSKGFSRQNLRFNLDNRLTPRLDVSLSTFYGRSTNDQAVETREAFNDVYSLDPEQDLFAKNPDGTPYRVGFEYGTRFDANPLYALATDLNRTDRTRFTANGQLRWRMLDWLLGEAQYGFDQESATSLRLTPFGSLSTSFRPLPGSLSRLASNGRTVNLGATLTATSRWGALSTTTRLSYVYEDQSGRSVGVTSARLVVKEVPEFSAADPSAITNSSSDFLIRNRNVFAVTTFDFRDRYIVDGLVRRDESSLFGPAARARTYFRLSGAWRVNEDLKLPGFDEIRLRASYGTAGLRPGFEYQYEAFTTSAGGFTKGHFGNRSLRPAHSAELEVGANVELAGGRLSLEYNWSRKDTRDQIVPADLPSVVGYTSQWKNVGSLRSSTHELGLGWQALNHRSLSWTLNLVADRSRTVITEWLLPERLEFFLLRKSGSRLGTMYGSKAVKSFAELYEDPDKWADSLPGGRWDRDSVVVNEDGFLVRRSAWRTLDERRIRYFRCADAGCTERTDVTIIGNADPDFTANLASVTTWGRLTLSTLVSWSQGGNVYNLTRQTLGSRAPEVDQRGKPEEEKKGPDYYQFYDVSTSSGNVADDRFVESGTFVKVREVSVNYVFVRDQLRRVGLGRLDNVRLGLVGRNLFTFTRYLGFDPEVSYLGRPVNLADPFTARVDYNSYPSRRTFAMVVEIAF